MSEFISTYGGVTLAGIGVLYSVILAGFGSSRGCGMVGSAAAGIIAEEPEKFGKALLLQLLPGTQGLYGFIVGFLIALQITANLPVANGLFLLLVAMPVGTVGLYSAIRQAEVSTAGLQILAKNPDHNTKGMIFAAIVETYAILGFVASIILLFVTYTAVFA